MVAGHIQWFLAEETSASAKASRRPRAPVYSSAAGLGTAADPRPNIRPCCPVGLSSRSKRCPDKSPGYSLPRHGTVLHCLLCRRVHCLAMVLGFAAICVRWSRSQDKSVSKSTKRDPHCRPEVFRAFLEHVARL